VDPSDEPIFYRDAKRSYDYDDTDIFESSGIQTRQLLSPVIYDLSLRNLKADNEVMFRESVLAKIVQDRSLDFNLGQAIKYFGQARVLICSNYKCCLNRARASLGLPKSLDFAHSCFSYLHPFLVNRTQL